MPNERRRRLTLLGLAVVSVVALGVSFAVDTLAGDDDASTGGESAAAGDGGESGDGTSDDEADEEPEEDPEVFETDFEGLADPAGFGRPWPNAAWPGLLTFRGNPSRSFYGVGPVPRTTPVELYRFPDQAMCRSSLNLGETKVWCGMGWTGQPTIVEREDRTWAIFGGYDGHVHFMDTATGQRILPDVVTDDIIKGTPTIDPDGYPLAYSGSRDNYIRVMAFDRPGQAEVLYKLHAEAVKPTLWNDDWDSSPLILDDYMIVGSESSRFWVVKLNRSYDAAGLVQVDPEVVFTTEAWDQEVLAANGDNKASVESSVAVYEDTVYFGTTAGLILGYDLAPLSQGGTPEKVFRFWTGGDNDASVVVDEDGMLYIGSQYDRNLQRARDVGQLTKLDPSNPVNPIVWKVDDSSHLSGGVYGTPAVYGDTVYVGTNGGRLMGVDRATGAIRWTKQFSLPLWGSPVVVDDVLLMGDCEGFFHAWDVSNPRIDPPPLWTVELGGCIEATPAVWKDRIYIGTRAGYLHVLATAGPPATSTSTTDADAAD